MKLRTIGITAAVLAAAAIAPASANALTVAPSSIDFGANTVGSPTVRTVTVNTSCIFPNPLGGCLVSESFSASPAFTGANPGDFSQTNNCPPTISGSSGTCTFSVTYLPTATGTRGATLTLGNGGFPIPTPRTVSLTGTATAVPVVPVTPTPPKKCKKKGKKAGVAKKCKKKK